MDTATARDVIHETATDGLWSGRVPIAHLLPAWVSPAVAEVGPAVREAFLTQATPPRLLASWIAHDMDTALLTQDFCAQHMERTLFSLQPFDEIESTLKAACFLDTKETHRVTWGHHYVSDDHALPANFFISDGMEACQEWCRHLGTLVADDSELLHTVADHATHSGPTARAAMRTLLTVDHPVAHEAIAMTYARPLPPPHAGRSAVDEITEAHICPHSETPPSSGEPTAAHLHRVIAMDAYGARTGQALIYAATHIAADSTLSDLIGSAFRRSHAIHAAAVHQAHALPGGEALLGRMPYAERYMRETMLSVDRETYVRDATLVETEIPRAVRERTGLFASALHDGPFDSPQLRTWAVAHGQVANMIPREPDKLLAELDLTQPSCARIVARWPTAFIEHFGTDRMLAYVTSLDDRHAHARDILLTGLLT